ncbi:hypothetical protein TRIP_C60048 [Candidatus Zixiibacteriota bacterium]|nr:hypothetical protein TRIP_C60048 [candidate division Zixibacteria bacterium]
MILQCFRPIKIIISWNSKSMVNIWEIDELHYREATGVVLRIEMGNSCVGGAMNYYSRAGRGRRSTEVRELRYDLAREWPAGCHKVVVGIQVVPGSIIQA